MKKIIEASARVKKKITDPNFLKAMFFITAALFVYEYSYADGAEIFEKGLDKGTSIAKGKGRLMTDAAILTSGAIASGMSKSIWPISIGLAVVTIFEFALKMVA